MLIRGQDISNIVLGNMLSVDCRIDHDTTKGGYEIPFNRHFHLFEPPRELAEIDADLKNVTDRIKATIEGLSA
jgi:type I restriction enzyme M protein